MALTDPRQGWGEGGLQSGSTCSNPWARGWGEAQAWVLGWVCAAPILASLTRLLSWAQPSAPCLALIDLPVRGLVWPWHIFPLSLWASSPLPQSWKWLRALPPSLGFQILGLQDRKVSPWNEPHPPNIQCFTSGLGPGPVTESHCLFPCFQGGGTVSTDFHLPIPPRPAFPGCGRDLASPPGPSSPADPGVESPGARQACRCWAWGGGCLAAGVRSRGGHPSPFLCKAGACFLSSLSAPLAGEGTGNGGSGKKERALGVRL